MKGIVYCFWSIISRVVKRNSDYTGKESGFLYVPSVVLWVALREGRSTERVPCFGMLSSTPGSFRVPRKVPQSALQARL